MKPEYDAVVVGAGVAGCTAATALGIRGKGLKILLIDRNPRTEVGKKTALGWICGDAVGEHHARLVEKELGIGFGLPEIENRVNALVVASPDREARVPFEGPGFLLDRPKFARRLLDEALKTGVEYRESTHAVDLLTEGDLVTGVVCQERRDGQAGSYKITSKLVIDASGMSTVLRRNLRISGFIEKEIDRDDVEATIRLNARLAPSSKVDTSRCEMYLDAERAPGGYLWVFPKAADKVNMGLGVQQRRTTKSLQTLLDEWIAATPLFKGMTPLSGDGNLPGAWQVSVRHQNDSLVANGFMLVGDSGWFPNPITGGGIGPAMTGGVIAGQVAAQALEADVVTEANLWRYNTRYVEKYGRKTAALEVFRIYIQTLSNSELNHGLGLIEAAGEGLRNFITHDEAGDFTLDAVPKLSPTDKIVKVALGLHKLITFRGLAYVVSKMSELNRLYDQYPISPSAFPEWKKMVHGILQEVRARFLPT